MNNRLLPWDECLLTWKKQGRIVAPDNAPAWRKSQAGMISAVPLANGLTRLFLTGRDDKGRYQIGWLDLDDQFAIVAENPGNPVLTAGRMGCFDGQGVCMPTVVRVTDQQLYMYYVGWGLTAPGFFVNRCGLAISDDDGVTWRRWSEAPLDLLDGRDPIGIGTVGVLRERPDFWRLWYTTFREWRQLPDGNWQHYYHIKYAESADGIHWEKPANNLAVDFVDDKEYCVARPCVIKEATGYRLWFCTRSEGATYRISYAESPDGRTWKRKPAGIEPSPTGWDSEMIEYAYVLKRDSRYIMFYNGNGFGASGTGVALSPQ